MQYLVYIC